MTIQADLSSKRSDTRQTVDAAVITPNYCQSISSVNPQDPRSMDGEQARTSRGPRLGLGLGAVVIAGLLAAGNFVGGRLWFFSDDWNMYAYYHRGNLLEPFNGHLSLIPAGLYQLLFRTLGVGSYTPYRWLGLAALALLGFQVLRYGLPRLGPWFSAVAVAAVLWNSFGATNVLFPFLMNFSLPLACLLGIWWNLDKDQPHNDWRAGLWFAVALATSAMGLVIALAVGVELLARRSPMRRYVPFGVPGVIWLVWWLTHRDSTEITTNITGALEYAARMVWGGTTALAAGWKPGGILLAVFLAGLFGTRFVVDRRIDPRIAGALCAIATFVIVTAFTRLENVPPIPPDELRYGWTVGALIVFALISLAASRVSSSPDQQDPSPAGNPHDPHQDSGLAVSSEGSDDLQTIKGGVVILDSELLTRLTLVAISLMVLAGAYQLVVGMNDWADSVAEAAPGLRSVIYATEAVGADRIDGERILPLSYVPVSAGAYLSAVADIGSPLENATKSTIGGSAESRVSADLILAESLDFSRPPDPEPQANKRCDTTVQASPGSVVSAAGADTTAAGGPGDPAVPDETAQNITALPTVIDAGRFAPPGSIAEWVLEPPAILPSDDRIGTNVMIPYRLESASGEPVCVSD